MRHVLALLVLVGVASVAAAGDLEQGENEVTLRASYTDTDFGSSQGLDLGGQKDTDLSVSYGWLVTDHHEFGLVAGYVKTELDGGDLFADVSQDGTRLGGFYHYNFGCCGNLNPYVGAVLSTLGGDLGDAYDFQYSLEVGLKLYPFDHGGVSVGLGYSELRADAQGLPDADGISLGVGLLLKY